MTDFIYYLVPLWPPGPLSRTFRSHCFGWSCSHYHSHHNAGTKCGGCGPDEVSNFKQSRLMWADRGYYFECRDGTVAGCGDMTAFNITYELVPALDQIAAACATLSGVEA